MGRRARNGLAGLLCALTTAACLVRRPAPDLPPPEPAHEIRRRAYADGATESEVSLLVWPDGHSERDGAEREFHPNGALRAERFFEHDAPAGVWRSWFADGAPRSEVSFESAPPAEALGRFWHANGRLAAEGPTLAGRREGCWSYFDPDGGLLRRGSYRNGQRDGPWCFYDEHGAKRAEGSYALGRRIGTWTLWDADGVPRTRAAEEVELDEAGATSVPSGRSGPDARAEAGELFPPRG